jgi:hypothetical protein
MLPNNQCDTEGAAACRKLIGEPFIEVEVDGTRYRYSGGCDRACGDQDVPSLAAGLESNNSQYLAACDAERIATVTLAPGSQPIEISLCGRDTNVCQTYQLSDWAADSTPLREGVFELMGRASAKRIDDQQASAQPSPLALHFLICRT